LRQGSRRRWLWRRRRRERRDSVRTARTPPRPARAARAMGIRASRSGLRPLLRQRLPARRSQRLLLLRLRLPARRKLPRRQRLLLPLLLHPRPSPLRRMLRRPPWRRHRAAGREWSGSTLPRTSITARVRNITGRPKLGLICLRPMRRPRALTRTITSPAASNPVSVAPVDARVAVHHVVGGPFALVPPCLPFVQSIQSKMFRSGLVLLARGEVS